MPAKRPAPKSAKGKKAASRPAVKKAVLARKLPAERVSAAAHVRKSATAPMKAASHPFSTDTEEPIEMRKAGQAAPEAAPKESPSAPSEVTPIAPAVRALPRCSLRTRDNAPSPTRLHRPGSATS